MANILRVCPGVCPNAVRTASLGSQRQPTSNKRRARNHRFQARSVIPGSLSKPPPSASRPPHRAPASIRDQHTYTETLAGEALRRLPFNPSPLMLNATTRVLCIVGMLFVLARRLGTLLSTHGAFFRSVCSENGRKTRRGDGFLDRRLRASCGSTRAQPRGQPHTRDRDRISTRRPPPCQHERERRAQRDMRRQHDHRERRAKVAAQFAYAFMSRG